MNKIIIDGKEYELSDELSEKIKAEVAAQEKAEAERLAEQGPFARAICKRYFLINGVGKVSSLTEGATITDGELPSIANVTDASLIPVEQSGVAGKMQVTFMTCLEKMEARMKSRMQKPERFFAIYGISTRLTERKPKPH